MSTPTTTTTSARPLLVTDELDGSAALVIDRLHERGVEPQIFQCSRLALLDATLSIIDNGSSSIAILKDGDATEQMHIWPGRRVLRRRPDLGLADSYERSHPAVTAFVLDQYRSALNSFFTLDANWMNPVAAERSFDQNKLLASRVARSAGLRPIPTLLTDDPDEWTRGVRAFTALGAGDLAVKAASAWAARIENEDAVLALYTQRVSCQEALEMADSVRRAPVLLQPYVEKAYELRVTVVDEQIFACRIDSQSSERTAVDWRRYDLPNTPHSIESLGTPIEAAIRRFMSYSGLLYAAIDMIVTPEGNHYFVEANPASQFGWIEELTGLPISTAIADWLMASS